MASELVVMCDGKQVGTLNDVEFCCDDCRSAKLKAVKNVVRNELGLKGKIMIRNVKGGKLYGSSGGSKTAMRTKRKKRQQKGSPVFHLAHPEPIGNRERSTADEMDELNQQYYAACERLQDRKRAEYLSALQEEGSPILEQPEIFLRD